MSESEADERYVLYRQTHKLMINTIIDTAHMMRILFLLLWYETMLVVLNTRARRRTKMMLYCCLCTIDIDRKNQQYFCPWIMYSLTNITMNQHISETNHLFIQEDDGKQVNHGNK